jgi:hypothetical protein
MDFIQYEEEAVPPQLDQPLPFEPALPSLGPGLVEFSAELNPECAGSDFLLGC